ncbi:MAG: hypothetical protein QF798_03260 [Candidatus Woesearchaeota archaeon]|jgi:hypothetical protein|nr:hypothetical protein [Candidatus Woesearchaeota archaeon]|tara:strand:- start:3788 stop:4273 length:486 start_codon:yes stop_codon:yes gene_type:complete
MEKFQELRDAANKKLKLADHILTMTYPLVNDPRLLISSLENLFLTFTYGMSSLLYYERLFKRIPPFPDNFASKFDLFKDKCSKKYNLDSEYQKIIQEIKEIIISRKKSPMEFSRNNSLIICNGNYRMKTVTENTIRDYVQKAKSFVKNISAIVSKDEAIFR